MWNQIQSSVLGPFVENNASLLNSLINSSTKSGSIYNVLNEDMTKRKSQSKYR